MKLVVRSPNTILRHVIVHCLMNINDRMVLKPLQRKDCNQLMSVKSDLGKVKLEDVGLRSSNPIFIIKVCVLKIGCSGPKGKDYTI